MCFCSVKRFTSLVFTQSINQKHLPLIFGCIDVNYFVIIKEYISMNTCKQQSINISLMEVLVIQKPVHFYTSASSANQWFGFCIGGTSVMKYSRRSSSKNTESLFLHVAKRNLLFLFQFFFYLGFFSRIFTIHRTEDERGDYFLMSFCHFYPFHGHLDIAGLLLQRAHICAQLAAGIEHGIFGTRSLEFILSTLALVAAVFRRMLKTRVTLGNISRVLFGLTKRQLTVTFCL